MENQHRKIKGYRDLSQEEINLMNEIKEKAAEVGNLVACLENESYSVASTESGHHSSEHADQRWVAIGKTDLQKGFMALTRSIAKPGFF